MPDTSDQSPGPRPDFTKPKATTTVSSTVSPGPEDYVRQFAPNRSKKRKVTHDTSEGGRNPRREPILRRLPTWDYTIRNILKEAGVVPRHLKHVSDNEGRDMMQVWTEAKLSSEIEEKIRGVVVAAFGGSLGKLEFGVGDPPSLTTGWIW